ncbi:hypothetical protein A2239_02525 [Candidatus Uhrbacteria bacterium RIFOXYA2_FULL_40_9]|nr:MAG: hypothetical protein UT94_C0002G0014 [Candidatus Uhrbacteria bacterium GW2011_GWF2_40_263]OGL93951.1 MAG: hypothetical protein A2239_02525 [Candidatus Uhrbacteria bacterium RIFOXYA2_FULL_40_9]OGL97400.1 MAG: hypothetical protein A2332_04755 [Candidatus Uhrbacteria bacterium RIFOXYB2_FULL_41_18]HBK35009.1 hypothetical protein [Candidatus Uhrbacteria bacterium]HCB56163.1 hypothetical protein [Candidatus Uhrbacteria bacterium]
MSGAFSFFVLKFLHMESSFQNLLRAMARVKQEQEEGIQEDTISVSDTVSVAASVYELLRNTLEYDEEHLLRRNAIRRILRRRIGEEEEGQLASNLLRELIWARYFRNKTVPERMIGEVTIVLKKYHSLFRSLEVKTKEGQKQYDWLIDVLSSEIEYLLVPPQVDEALANYTYQEIRKRLVWQSKLISEEDQDLQLYIAVHRAILKSNMATLRYRVFSLFYPKWRQATVDDPLITEIVDNLSVVIDAVDRQITHSGGDKMFRLVRKYAIVFKVIGDIAADDPDAFHEAVMSQDKKVIEKAISRAAEVRYASFRSRLFRGVMRATLFLFFTKMLLALIVEAPYEIFVLHTTNFLPLTVNILFPPFLLSLLGFSVRIPAKKNTVSILEKVWSLLGFDEDFKITVKMRRSWAKGPLGVIFNILYITVFLFSILVITSILRIFDFNILSILFFLLFLSLVAFFGLKLRHTKRDLVVLESAGGFFGFISDILFLPIVRTGRWIAMRAPRINIFLFFFDFIIEAPFKAAISIIESWLAFLREKKEEI